MTWNNVPIKQIIEAVRAGLARVEFHDRRVCVVDIDRYPLEACA